MKKSISIVVTFIAFIYACQSVDDPTDSLYHSPTGEVNINVADSSIVVNFSLDKGMHNVMASSINQNEIATIKTRKDLISYYNNLPPSFLPGYSNQSVLRDHFFSKVEYLLAQECVQDDCSSQTRKNILTIAINKQKSKFKDYETPSYTRRTGAFLIAIILLKEGDLSFIQSLSTDTTIQNSFKCLQTEIWIHEENSNILVHYAENYLAN